MRKHIVGLMLALVIVVIGGQATVGASSSSTHKVVTGDTLWEIAQNNNVSVDDLFTWNELESTLIFPEQEIQIDSKTGKYIVKKGDTLSEIAKAHGVSLDDLMAWNGITSYLIYPGEELSIGGAKKMEQTASVKNNAPKVETPKSETQAKASPKTETPAKSSPKTETAKETKSAAPPATNKEPVASSGKEMTVTATAYTAYCEGCSGTTYTGIDLRANPNQKVIAVDPSIIPLGSRVWVEGYGEAIAGDIGGAIKGNIIDVFIENQQEALNWGRKTVKIKVLD